MEEFDFECDVCDRIDEDDIENELKKIIFSSRSSNFNILFNFSKKSIAKVSVNQKITLAHFNIGNDRQSHSQLFPEYRQMKSKIGTNFQKFSTKL